MSALTLLEGPNKVPYRNLFTSHFPLFTSTKNSVIPAANHSSDPLHMHTCNMKSMGQFSTWYRTMCHGTSGHVSEQSMSLNVGKTIVQ